MPLYRYSSETLQEVAKRLYGPRAKGHLFTGLWMSVEDANGEWHQVFDREVDTIVARIAKDKGVTVLDLMRRR